MRDAGVHGQPKRAFVVFDSNMTPYPVNIGSVESILYNVSRFTLNPRILHISSSIIFLASGCANSSGRALKRSSHIFHVYHTVVKTPLSDAFPIC
jgi:hypothetical protein